MLADLWAEVVGSSYCCSGQVRLVLKNPGDAEISKLNQVITAQEDVLCLQI